MADIDILNPSPEAVFTRIRIHTAKISATVQKLDANNVIIGKETYLVSLAHDQMSQNVRESLEDIVTKMAKRAGRIA